MKKPKPAIPAPISVKVGFIAIAIITNQQPNNCQKIKELQAIAVSFHHIG
ncbi:hypothetical protein [Pedobacter jamesrossensis]